MKLPKPLRVTLRKLLVLYSLTLRWRDFRAIGVGARPPEVYLSSTAPGTEFSVETLEGDGCAVVAVGGEADLHTAPLLKGELVRAIDSGARRLVVDFSRTTFIDSTVLGNLVRARKRLVTAGGEEVALVATDSTVVRVLEVTGLDRVFAIFPTREAAMRAPAATS